MNKANVFRVNGEDFYTGGPTSWMELLSYADSYITGKTIPASTGVPTDSSNYFRMYVFYNPKFKQVKFHTSIWGDDLAEIAFYSGDSMTAENYDSTNSKVNTSGDNNHHYAVADVPDTAKIVVLTSRNLLNDSTPFQPEAWADTNYNFTKLRSLNLADFNLCYGSRDETTDEPTGEPIPELYTKRVLTSKMVMDSPEIIVNVDYTKGYQFRVGTHLRDGYYYESAWYSSEYHYKLCCDWFRIIIKRVVNDSEVDMHMTGFADIGLTVQVAESEKERMSDSLIKTIVKPDKRVLEEKLSKRFWYGSMFNGYRFLCHMLVDKIGNDDILVPCQSLANIEIAHRLGYKMFELNVHKTATAGVYVCMHGTNGKIGKELVDPGGTDITNVAFSEVTESTFRNTYVYRTTSDKYRTHITFLDEALLLLKKYGMVPYVQFPSGEYGIVDYIRKLIGDNFVLYVGNDYYLKRTVYDGVLNYYGTLDADALAKVCKSLGAPYIHSVTSEQASEYTDAQLTAMIEAAHENGCLICIPSAYITPAKNIHLMELGFDGYGADYEVEDFDNGNLCSLHDNNTFTDFTTSGSVSGGKLSLTNNQTIASALSGTAPFLSKGSLKIKYSGTLVFNMGERFYNVSITSDGRKEVWLSTWFMNQLANFSAKASGAVTVYSCTYEASAC